MSAPSRAPSLEHSTEDEVSTVERVETTLNDSRMLFSWEQARLELENGASTLNVSVSANVDDDDHFNEFESALKTHAEQLLGLSSFGSLSRVVRVLEHAKWVQVLRVGHEIGVAGTKILSAGLLHANSLKTLDLGYNKMKVEGAVALAPALKELKSLTKLRLYLNCLRNQGVAALVPAITQLKLLTTLELGNNCIGVPGLAALATVFRECRALTTLGLSSNKIDASAMLALAQSLSHAKSLTSLDLKANVIDEAAVKALTRILKNCPVLANLDLSNNAIDAKAAAAFGSVLEECRPKRLSELNLSGNKFGGEGARALASGLKHCTSLTSLNWFSNKVDAESATALVPVLLECKLQTLILTCNRVGDAGAKAIASALPKCLTLRELCLEQNDIHDEGVKAICYSLSNHPAIETVRFNSSIITGSCSDAIISMVKTCPSLRRLQLRVADLRDSSLQAIYVARAARLVVGFGAYLTFEFASTLEKERKFAWHSSKECVALFAFLAGAVLAKSKQRGAKAYAFVHEDGDSAIVRRVRGMLGG